MTGRANDAQAGLARAAVANDLDALQGPCSARAHAPAAHGLEPKPELRRDLLVARAIISTHPSELHHGRPNIRRIELFPDPGDDAGERGGAKSAGGDVPSTRARVGGTAPVLTFRGTWAFWHATAPPVSDKNSVAPYVNVHLM